MPEITQEDRRLAIDTPLGEDVLLIDSFSGTEAVSQPFHFDVNLLADTVEGNDQKVDPKALLGEAMTIHIRSLDGKERLIHGLVRRFQNGAHSSHFATYSVELVPWLWLRDFWRPPDTSSVKLRSAAMCRLFSRAPC